MTQPILVTLVAASGLSQADLAAARSALAAAGGVISAEVALDPPCALDLVVRGLAPAAARAAVEPLLAHADLIAQPAGAARAKKLLVADMDSTMIGQECIDELADFAGRRAEIAAITERAMQGELDFAEALAARVDALAGLDAGAIDRCLAERITLTPGARTLVATMRARGAATLLVSGGFTAFAGPVAARIGFDRAQANRLGIRDGRLDGTVGTPILDSAAKRAALVAEAAALGVPLSATLAVGDGANDIPMLEAAGLGVAFRAKPRAAAAADAHIRLNDLGALLWAQGIARAHWVAG